MPLHDWDELTGWEGVHHFWITNLFHWIKPRLPPEYRAYVGSVPTLGVTGEAYRGRCLGTTKVRCVPRVCG